MHVKSYKVLFADDEYWTREKMARIIPWEKYSLEFLKPASDGEEVLERLSEEKPDILYEPSSKVPLRLHKAY